MKMTLAVLGALIATSALTTPVYADDKDECKTTVCQVRKNQEKEAKKINDFNDKSKADREKADKPKEVDHNKK